MVLIKCDGATPFRLAIIMTDATDEDLTVDVWCHTPTCAPPMKQNLRGRWTGCYLAKKTLQRTKRNAIHFDKDGQQRLIETIALGWYGVLWGRLEEMVDLKKKGKTIPPLKLSALHMIEENDSLDWSIDWTLREGGGKRKAVDVSEPAPSKSSRC